MLAREEAIQEVRKYREQIHCQSLMVAGHQWSLGDLLDDISFAEEEVTILMNRYHIDEEELGDIPN